MSKDPRAVEQPKKRKGPFARLRSFARASDRDVQAPARAVARERIRGKPGFYATLSPEARAAIQDQDGDEIIGPPRCER